MNRRAMPCVVAGAIAGMSAQALATDVYRNTTTRLTTMNPLCPAGAAASIVERGDAVTLAGTEREVTGIAVMMRIGDSGVATWDMRVRFYANDGPAGSPGTPLWDSGSQFCVIDSGIDLPYFFYVPGVRVPDTFTWTAEISNRAGGNQSALGLPHYSPPTIGSALSGYWERMAGVGAWSLAGLNEPPFGARVEAVTCYVNCDNSTTAPALNVNDFGCFLNRFAAGDRWANCDGSTAAPILNVQDFGCFLNRFAAGCS
jgi:hypothetical protein